MKNEQLTIEKPDMSIQKKLESIKHINAQRDQIAKLLAQFDEAQNKNQRLLGIKLFSEVTSGTHEWEFQLPEDFLENLCAEMKAYYKGVDAILIDEAKQLMTKQLMK